MTSHLDTRSSAPGLFSRASRRALGVLAAPFGAPGPKARRYTALALTLVAVLLVVAYAREVGGPIFPVDDAYISLHNAEVLISRGSDPQFVGTPAIVGSTSAVHVALIALVALVLPPLWAGWTVMCLGAIAYALATLRLAFAMRASVPEALLMIGASLVLAQMPHQLMNGLETAWALAGLTYALAAARDHDARPWELPVACGLLPFLRPELAAVSGLLMLLRVGSLLRARDQRGALRAIGYCVLAALPWMLLYLVSTGLPYPNTVAAKRAFFAEGCGPSEARFESVKNIFIAFKDSIGLFSYAAGLLVLTTTGWVGLVFAAVFAYAYYENFPGALSHYEQRYMYVLVPWLTYGSSQLIALRHALPRVLAAALFGCCIAQAWPEIVPRWQYHLACTGFTRFELDAVATWLDANAHGRKVLLHDAGYVGFFVDASLVDMVGLKTPSSVEEHRTLTWAECSGGARHRAIHRIALAQQPDFIVLLKGWDQVFGISHGLRQHGWQLQQRFDQAYVVFEVTGRPNH